MIYFSKLDLGRVVLISS